MLTSTEISTPQWKHTPAVRACDLWTVYIEDPCCVTIAFNWMNEKEGSRITDEITPKLWKHCNVRLCLSVNVIVHYWIIIPQTADQQLLDNNNGKQLICPSL